MSALYEHLSRRNQAGLRYDEAVQLFLWLFCSSDIVPPSLRSVPLDKEALVDTFHKLALEGLVAISPDSDKASVQDRIAWTKLIESLLSNRVVLDQEFPKRVHLYL